MNANSGLQSSRRRLGMGLMLMCAAATGFAQTESLLVDVGSCVRLQTPGERFACYEERVEEALGIPAVPAPIPAAAERSQAPRVPESRAVQSAPANPLSVVTKEPATVPQAGDDFGFAVPVQKVEVATPELIGRVAELKETLPNAYVITLGNGQIWRQTRPKANFPLEVGHQVRIYPTHWGKDYRLSVEQLRDYIQVVRVR